jgi:hypothetical protein
MKLNTAEPLWKQEWLGMPEFIQEKQDAYAKIIIRVENENDLIELSRLLGQKFTKKTKSAWYPAKSHWGAEKKVWKSNES